MCGKMFFERKGSMARKKSNNVTKASIVRVATEKFLRAGYSATTFKSISDELGISTGHITFYYPTKVHLLAVLVDMLCQFQWQLMNGPGDEHEANLSAASLELTTMAAMCEENEVARDFYLSAYTQPITLDIIRRNDAARAKKVFCRYCPDWTDDMFAEAEVLISGVEYATLMATESSPPLDVRIKGGLEQIFKIYNVPEDIRQRLISSALQQDYRSMGRRIFSEFIEYIEQENELVLEELLEITKGGE